MEHLLLDSMLILLLKDWIRRTALDTSYQEVQLDMLTASITEYDFLFFPLFVSLSFTLCGYCFLYCNIIHVRYC